MRVLLTTYPEKTIFQPMVTLAWALRTAGHEVRVATQPGFEDVITGAGLTAVPVGRRGVGNWRRLTEAYPDLAEAERVGLPSPYDAAVSGVGTRAEMTDGYASILELWHKQNNFPLVTGLVEFARVWQPDLVIWEPTTYAGAIAAAACGAAHGRLLWSIDVFGAARERFLSLGPGPDPLAGWIAGYGRKYGFAFDEELITGQFTIDPVPDPIRLDTRLPTLPVQYVPYGGAASVPDWLKRRSDRPRIGLTLGTTATEHFGGYTVSVPDILAALSDVDAEIVATLPDAEAAKVTEVPANTRIVPYVPLHALVPTCAAVINHAGPGTYLTTARYGVPQLAVPWEFDEPELARRATVHGSALTLTGSEVSGKAVRADVLRLLSEPSFTTRARELAARMAATPSPNDVVQALEDHVARRNA
ncbi:activator-dependent family glycosyltransferase [Amycolatopsis sp. NBC_01307]|uniref:activator-dependent family glycosyltransferase n=1 Tax=Amycolatopsis sp. NBC_01307 TaxID=2903561 RepID=UPI002E0E482C|nr:activator-dependent family glycosyltransferase [Amycolatopsis sp. NBC_01307]